MTDEYFEFTINCRSSAGRGLRLPSAIRHQSSAISHPPSAIRIPPSTSEGGAPTGPLSWGAQDPVDLRLVRLQERLELLAQLRELAHQIGIFGLEVVHGLLGVCGRLDLLLLLVVPLVAGRLGPGDGRLQRVELDLDAGPDLNLAGAGTLDIGELLTKHGR